jgi:hypothetical protein
MVRKLGPLWFESKAGDLCPLCLDRLKMDDLSGRLELAEDEWGLWLLCSKDPNNHFRQATRAEEEARAYHPHG